MINSGSRFALLKAAALIEAIRETGDLFRGRSELDRVERGQFDHLAGDDHPCSAFPDVFANCFVKARPHGLREPIYNRSPEGLFIWGEFCGHVNLSNTYLANLAKRGGRSQPFPQLRPTPPRRNIFHDQQLAVERVVFAALEAACPWIDFEQAVRGLGLEPGCLSAFREAQQLR